MQTIQTDQTPNKLANSILIAAMSLTGVTAGVAGISGQVQAEEAPAKADISVKFLRYHESQPGLERIHVNSPALALSVPIAGVWSLDASMVSDSVSGASPRYHTVISSASKMSDFRRAADLKLHRYFDRVKLSLGTSFSSEHDYFSKAYSVNASFASDDQNTTWNFGLGSAHDRIDANTRNVHDKKQGKDYLLGVTQVLSPQDLLQINLTHTRGHGYFADPYKSLDIRPRERLQTALNLRHHHHFVQTDSSLRLHYRNYRDSFGIRSHTLTAELAQPFAGGWTLTPSLRWYTQTAADFYFEPRYTILYIPVGYKIGSKQFVSEDQRMSAFGARTMGLKVSKQFDADWSVDLSIERYQQKSEWAFSQRNHLNLAPLTASIIQLGLQHQF